MAENIIRVVVFKRDNDSCRYCGDPATELDHVKPRNRQGRDHPDNVVAACSPCNRTKGAEHGFWMKAGVLYYHRARVAPDSLWGANVMNRVRQARRDRQIRQGLGWAVEQFQEKLNA